MRKERIGTGAVCVHTHPCLAVPSAVLARRAPRPARGRGGGGAGEEGGGRRERGEQNMKEKEEGNGGRWKEKRSGVSEGYKLCVCVGENNSEALWASWHMVIRILGESEFEALRFLFIIFYFLF